jgi:hypothetical protein
MLVLNENQPKRNSIGSSWRHTQPHKQRGGALKATPEGGLADPVTGEVFESLHCSPRQLMSPPSSLPMQPRRHQPRLIPLPPPMLRATSHARSALPYRLHATLRVVARSQTVGMTKIKLSAPSYPAPSRHWEKLVLQVRCGGRFPWPFVSVLAASSRFDPLICGGGREPHGSPPG